MVSLPRRQFIALSSTAAALAATGMSSTLFAQSIPNPAKFVCGFPAGDMMDIVARLFSQGLAGRYTSNVIVENKPGAGGRIAVAQVKEAAPDGANLLITPSPMLVLYPHVFQKLTYAPLQDFVPVSNLASTCFALSVGPMVPESVKTLADFLAWCKQNPAKANYGISAPGSGFHLAAETLSRVSGVPLTMVSYRGGSLALADALAGQIPATFSALPSVIEQHRAGRMRTLAVTSSQRMPHVPDVPTFAELGYPQVQFTDWFGVFLPAKTPAHVVARAHETIQSVVSDPVVIEKLAQLGLVAAPAATRDEFDKQVRRDYEMWAKVVRDVKFTPIA